MKVMVNGAMHDLGEGTTVAALVEAMTETTKGMAVAVNEEVVPRSMWSQVNLRPDDRVEVLTASRGG